MVFMCLHFKECAQTRHAQTSNLVITTTHLGFTTINKITIFFYYNCNYKFMLMTV